MPYETETAYDTGDYHAGLDKCLEAFGWDAKKNLQGRKIDGRYHGLGIACFVESSGAGPRENVRMTLDRDGLITIAIGPSVLGQGLETVFAQIAADALGCRLKTFACCTAPRHCSMKVLALIIREPSLWAAPRSWTARKIFRPRSRRRQHYNSVARRGRQNSGRQGVWSRQSLTELH